MNKFFAGLFLVFVSLFSFGQSAPTVKNDTLSICLGHIDTIAVLNNDSDADGDSIFIKQVLLQPQHGTVVQLGNLFAYTPNVGYIGLDKVYFQVCDNSAFNQCTYEFLVLNVDTCIPVNYAPLGKNDTATLCSFANTVFAPLSNDLNVDGDSLFVQQVLTHGVHGTDTLVGGIVLYQATDSIGKDTLSYVLCDVPASGLTSMCDTAFIVINIVDCSVPTNRTPSAQIDIVAAIEDLVSFPPFDPRDNDSDPDGDNLTWTPVFPPLNGTVFPFGGKWMYRPNPNFNGIDVMAYQLCDDGTPSLCTFSLVVFIVAAVNDAPKAVNDTFTLAEDNNVVLPVLDNDTDIDGDNLVSEIVTQPTHGAVVKLPNGDLSYTPSPNYNGVDEFTYQACDPSNKCSKAKVHLVITPVNDAPVAYADSVLLTDVQTSTIVDVVANDKDVENDALTITSVSGGSIIAGAIVTKDGKQQIEVTKVNTDACGRDSLNYTVCDGGGLCSTGVLYVEVLCNFKNLMPQGFSPNGDGINDNFVFPGLQYYRPFQFEVYNRWGHPVYTNDDYNNDWNGYAQDLNQPLPDGTYYYIVRLPDGREIVNYCIINR